MYPLRILLLTKRHEMRTFCKVASTPVSLLSLVQFTFCVVVFTFCRVSCSHVTFDETSSLLYVLSDIPTLVLFTFCHIFFMFRTIGGNVNISYVLSESLPVPVLFCTNDLTKRAILFTICLCLRFVLFFRRFKLYVLSSIKYVL